MASTGPASASGNRSLSKAKSAKQDEFYTQLSDIENELRHYREQFRGKVVLCNCDDPYESNFFRYFALNFNALGLKKLIATCYDGSSIAGGRLPLFEIEGLKPDCKQPYAVEITNVPDVNGDGAIDLTDVELLLKSDGNVSHTLTGDGEYGAGDFRSAACIEFLKQADVVVTNPPFSLFREFLALLLQHEKNFLSLEIKIRWPPMKRRNGSLKAESGREITAEICPLRFLITMNREIRAIGKIALGKNGVVLGLGAGTLT